MPPRRAEPAQHGVARGLLVEVHRLRIELRRKSDDLLARDMARPVFGGPGGVEIFEIILRHGSPQSPRAPTIPRRANSEASTRMIRRSGYRFADKIMRLSNWRAPGRKTGAHFAGRALTPQRCIDIGTNACSLTRADAATRGEGHVLYRRPVPV